MSDLKNKNYEVKPELKKDVRLREILIRMEVLTRADVKAQNDSIEDSSVNAKTFSISDIV